MYVIKSYQGFNDLKIGWTSLEIEEYMKIKPSKFKKNNNDLVETDAYDDFFVYYDDDGKSEAIEFNSNADLKFETITFFDRNYSNVEADFRKIDSNIEIDELGFISNKFGIGVYITNKDEEDSKIESVIIYKRGYYD